MSDETPIPLEDNWRCQLLLKRLRQGPASTLELQDELPFPHVARQVWELRHWYGYIIKTGRLPNRVALYTLVKRIDPPSQRKLETWDQMRERLTGKR